MQGGAGRQHCARTSSSAGAARLLRLRGEASCFDQHRVSGQPSKRQTGVLVLVPKGRVIAWSAGRRVAGEQQAAGCDVRTLCCALSTSSAGARMRLVTMRLATLRMAAAGPSSAPGWRPLRLALWMASALATCLRNAASCTQHIG